MDLNILINLERWGSIHVNYRKLALVGYLVDSSVTSGVTIRFYFYLCTTDFFLFSEAALV